MMLILSRKLGEGIIIANNIEVKILRTKGSQYLIGIDAPKDVPVHRKEIHLKLLASKKNAHRILLVEDDPISQKIIKTFLQELNFHCIDIASTGNDALSLFSQNKYSIVFLDINLPDITGIDVYKKIKVINNEPTPIVAITAYNKLEKECRQAGVNDFIVKPILFKTMENLVNHWLQLNISK